MQFMMLNGLFDHLEAFKIFSRNVSRVRSNGFLFL